MVFSDEMNIDDFAVFVFTKNTDNKAIALSLSGIDTSKDLFCFCFDMLCKGIVLLFGEKERRVAINDISYDDFELVCEKIKCLGIKCKLETFDTEEIAESAMDVWIQNLLNLERIQNSDDNKKLDEYHFDIQTTEKLYRVTFDVIHNTDDIPTTLHRAPF